MYGAAMPWIGTLKDFPSHHCMSTWSFHWYISCWSSAWFISSLSMTLPAEALIATSISSFSSIVRQVLTNPRFISIQSFTLFITAVLCVSIFWLVQELLVIFLTDYWLFSVSLHALIDHSNAVVMHVSFVVYVPFHFLSFFLGTLKGLIGLKITWFLIGASEAKPLSSGWCENRKFGTLRLRNSFWYVAVAQ